MSKTTFNNGFVFTLALSLLCNQLFAQTDSKTEIDEDGNFNLVVSGINPDEVVDVRWNGRSLIFQSTDSEGDANGVVVDEANGLRILIPLDSEAPRQELSHSLFEFESENGLVVQVPISLDLANWELKRDSRAIQVSSCGGQTSSGNPYPCCDNNANGVTSDSSDGNCTWYAWKMASDNWGHRLPSMGNAKSWDDDSVRAFNRSTGYVPQSTPSNGSIAVSNSYGGSTGHVAWVTSFTSSNVTAREMNCSSPAILPNVRTKTYTRSTFQQYLTGLYVYDHWVKSLSITADPSSSVSRPNFDAQFKIKNLNPATRFSISRLALSVHNSSGQFLYDFFRAPGNSTAAVFTASELSSAAGNGLDSGEYIHVPKSYAYFRTPGTYRIVAKIQIGSSWIEVGRYTITVR